MKDKQAAVLRFLPDAVAFCFVVFVEKNFYKIRSNGNSCKKIAHLQETPLNTAFTAAFKGVFLCSFTLGYFAPFSF